MRQSYFGSTASAAIAQAKLDAGDDVVLVELRAELNGAGFTAIIETEPEPPAQTIRAVPRQKRGVMAFVGPCGAGKTSSLVKVAVACGLRQGLSVGLVTLDDRRFGAVAQFRSFAEILGTPMLVPRNQAELAGCREHFPGAGLILIDTPGLGSNRTSEMAQLAARLAGVEELETHLVVNAEAGRAQLERAIQQWSVLRPSYILPTHIEELAAGDEALLSLGSLPLPVSYFGTGPSIPEDLEIPGALPKREPGAARLLAKHATAA